MQRLDHRRFLIRRPGQLRFLAICALLLTLSCGAEEGRAPERLDSRAAAAAETKPDPGAKLLNEISEALARDYRPKLAALINGYRRSRGLSVLALDACLNRAAQKHSRWMADTKVFGHEGENGSLPAQRCQRAGCACSGENIYFGSLEPREAFESWKTSPGHDRVLLGSFSRIGIGAAEGYITADFQR